MILHVAPGLWQPHWDAWVLVALLLGGYETALAVWGPHERPRRADVTGGRRAVTRSQHILFLVGVAVLWVASDGPVHQLADRLFSVHMLQHTLYSLVAAPLLLLGTPAWLFRRLFRPRPVHAVIRFVTKPLVALAIFNVWIAAYHAPALVNASVQNDLVHLAVHVVWVVTALIMWWPVLSPLPELPHLSTPLRALYVFAQSIVPTVPASFLTFSRSVLYDAYDTALPWGIAPVADQQWAGLLMKIGGGVILWTVITVLFFLWYREEERGEPDVLYWRELEAELDDIRHEHA